MMKLIPFIRNFLNKGHERSVLAKKQILLSFFFKGFSIILYFLSVPLLINYLDSEKYGIWLTLTSIISWFTFFDAGLGNGLRNKLAESIAIKDLKLAKVYVSTTYALVSGIFISLIIIFVCINFSLDWGRILNTKNIPLSELSLFTLIVFSQFLLRFIFNLIGIILTADQKPSINNAFEPIGSAVSLLLIFILTKIIRGEFILFGFIMSFFPLLVLIIASIILFKKRYRQIRPSYKSIEWKYSKELIGVGSKFFIIQIASLLLFSTANVILTQIYGPESVVSYNVAFRYFQIPIMGYSIILIPMWSSVTNAYILKDFDWIKRTFKKLQQVSILFYLATILMLLFSNLFYKMWLGNKIHIPVELSVSMALFALINLFSAPLSQIINGTGKIYLTVTIIFLIILFYVPFAVFLAKTRLRESGVMFATCLLNGIPQIFYYIQVKKLISDRASGIWNK